MKTLTSSAGWKVSYPDTLLFAFNRILVKVSNEGDNCNVGDTFQFTISKDGTSYTDTRQVGPDYTLEIVISRYLQLLFDTEDIMQERPYITATVTIERTAVAYGALTEGGETVSFDLKAYWGCVSAGERIRNRTVRCWGNLKTPVSYWQLDSGTVMTETDDSTSGTSKITQTYNGNEITTEIIYDCGTSGVYLKWIDNTGLWNYYLFDEGKKTWTTKDIGDSYEQFQMEDDETYGYYGVTKPIGKTNAFKQEICAPLVSKNERRMLRTILNSPMVFWCPDLNALNTDDEQWLPVTIAAGSTTDENANYDDFTVTVNFPDIQAQTL